MIIEAKDEKKFYLDNGHSKFKFIEINAARRQSIRRQETFDNDSAAV
jgi:hypothetical protein